MKIVHLVYDTSTEKYLGYNRLDASTLIGGAWYDSDVELYYPYDAWGARVVDIPDMPPNRRIYELEHRARVANLIFFQQKWVDSTFKGVLCVPADISNINQNSTIRDLEIDFLSSVSFFEFMGIGEDIGLNAVAVDSPISFMPL